MVDWPIFEEKNEKYQALKIRNWMEKTFTDAAMMPQRLLRLGWRTPDQILKSKKVVSYFDCLDLIGVAATALQKNGFKVQIVTKQVFYNNEPGALHFVIEAQKNGFECTFDPRSAKKIGFLPKWQKLNHQDPFNTLKDHSIEFREINRRSIPQAPENVSVFALAGIQNKKDYIQKANASIRGMVARLKVRRERKQIKKARPLGLRALKKSSPPKG